MQVEYLTVESRGVDIEREYGVPIVNKRVSVTPISLVGGAASPEGYLKIAHTLQRAADTLGTLAVIAAVAVDCAGSLLAQTLCVLGAGNVACAPQSLVKGRSQLVLADDEIDAVFYMTGWNSRVKYAIETMKAGKYVVVQTAPAVLKQRTRESTNIPLFLRAQDQISFHTHP